MDLVTHAVLVLSAVAITLGLLYLRFWFSERSRKDFLFFALACFSTAVYSWFEIAIMNSDSLEHTARLLWWAQFPATFAVISVPLFLYLYLNNRRRWLFWSIVSLRVLGLLANFFLTPSINFRELTRIDHVNILGEVLSVPVGIGSPWGLINLAAQILFLIYCIDTTITVWRRGEHRKAVIFGGGVTAFFAFTGAIATSVVWFPLGLPLLASPAIMFLVLGIGFELNYDLHRSAQLAETLEHKESELRESLGQLRLSADAANVGVWIRDMKGNLLWGSEKYYELFDFDSSKRLTFDHFIEAVHPDEREIVKKTLTAARAVGDEYEIEYRLRMQNSKIRWVRGNGRVDVTSDGTMIIRGATVDITKLKLAQQSAHDLSQKLMGAQEKERGRLARELHDDLSQSLALLSIQLQSLVEPSGGNGKLKSKILDLTDHIERLSSDVHRISHELHPAKLEQLGLEAALRGFFREMSAAHRFKVDFESSNVPRDLGNDVSLCLYRVAQEALQNIAKHSNASNVNVSLSGSSSLIQLVVADNGSGFDPEAVNNGESLGLISIQERLRAVDGEVDVDSEPGEGTKIVAKIPYISAER